jgi:hypothetical protein
LVKGLSLGIGKAMNESVREKTRAEDRPTEDDVAREKLGPRGVPGGPDKTKMTPQREKKTPKSGGFDGHTA